MTGVVRSIRSAVARFSRSAWFRRHGPRIMPPLERAIARATGGRVQLSGLLVPSLVLHSIGARSGIERDTVLMFVPLGDDCLVTGSNFASPSHPAWTANLLAHPDATVSLHGRRVEVTARLVEGEEREAMWEVIEAQWPGYRGYERQSGRALRIFRLERRRRAESHGGLTGS